MQNKYFVQLDGLRALAVIFVMFSHWTDSFNAFRPYNRIGAYAAVDLFFVLSGFLITLILLKAKYKGLPIKITLKQFYIRRFLRIFPLYYAVILIGVIFSIPYARHHLITLALYLANIKMAFNSGRLGEFPHFWSLSVEEQFYLIFPLLLLVVPTKHIKTLAWTLIILGIGTRILPYLYNPIHEHAQWFTYAFTTCCLDSFGIGALLACYIYSSEQSLNEFLTNYKVILLLPGIIGVMLICFYGDRNPLVNILFRLLVSIASFWIIGTAASNSFKGIFKSFLLNKTIVYIGKISYGIYVYHYFVIYAFRNWTFSNPNDISGLILKLSIFFICTISVSSLSYHIFEKPINDLKRYFEYN